MVVLTSVGFAEGAGCEITEAPAVLVTPASGISITGEGTGAYYLALDACDGCRPAAWVFEETNGYEGLQRADEVHHNVCGLVWPDAQVQVF